MKKKGFEDTRPANGICFVSRLKFFCLELPNTESHE